MAVATKKPVKLGLEKPREQIHRIWIIFSSMNIKNLKKGCFYFVFQFINLGFFSFRF
jgi:hypothetical protein